MQKGRPAINIFKSRVLTDFFRIWSEPTPSLINRLNCTLPKKGCVGSLIISQRIFQRWWNDNWVVDYWPPPHSTNFYGKKILVLFLLSQELISTLPRNAAQEHNILHLGGLVFIPGPPLIDARALTVRFELRCTISQQVHKKCTNIRQAPFVNSTFYSITIRCLSLWATLSKLYVEMLIKDKGKGFWWNRKCDPWQPIKESISRLTFGSAVSQIAMQGWPNWDLPYYGER